MKASQLIEKLKFFMEKYGDLPVYYNDEVGPNSVDHVKAYTEDGMFPGDNGKDAAEIFLH